MKGEEMDIKEKLELLEEIMDVDEGSLSEDMDLDDIEEWDSLSALALTVEVLKRFGIKLSTDKIKEFKTVQDICDIMG